MIILAVDVLIGYLDGHDAHHDSAMRLLEREIDEEFWVSSLTMAEVLVEPARVGRLVDALDALRDLEVSEHPFPADTAVKLAELRATTGLRMPDCCVLLAARELQARVASGDIRLLNAAEKIGLEVVTS